jgi:peptidoglycan hydrolase-like protein with peptidoglycan-binding domain
MKKVFGTLMLTAAVCGLLAASPAEARYYGTTTTIKSGSSVNLTRADIIAIQQSLVNRGFYVGKVDGTWGPMTASAMTSFQSSRGLPATGSPTRESLALLGVTPVHTASSVYVAPYDIEPAAGPMYTSTSHTSVFRTRTTGSFAAINSPNVNGSTCLTCTNGIIGNGGTPSMPSNAY